MDGETPNVLMWGAKGDGINNDTTNIMNAIAACSFFAHVSELLFPDGTYLITNTLVFNGTFLHIRGAANADAVVEMQYGINKDIFHSNNADDWLNGVGNPNNYDNGMLFEDMKLVFQLGNTNNNPLRNMSNAGLVVGQIGEVSTIRNVMVLNGGIGIRCLGALGAPGIEVSERYQH